MKLYAVLALKRTLAVNTTKGERDFPYSEIFAQAIGVIPVFDNRKAAQQYAKGAPIIELEGEEEKTFPAGNQN